MTENIRTFALPFESQNYTFKMQYEYDSWNRIQSFTFSAKEKDFETGLSYFGSRYYNSDLSVWLSVDPQSGFVQKKW